ncbi:hypothetical protein GALL_384830 [mine drainage metagenome]|uniref:Uncharacterized protein n=1 Tax=mine drainage metagenome TaxID=410659 RepID=A0A1J5Q9B0_9ZZZZ
MVIQHAVQPVLSIPGPFDRKTMTAEFIHDFLTCGLVVLDCQNSGHAQYLRFYVQACIESATFPNPTWNGLDIHGTAWRMIGPWVTNSELSGSETTIAESR